MLTPAKPRIFPERANVKELHGFVHATSDSRIPPIEYEGADSLQGSPQSGCAIADLGLDWPTRDSPRLSGPPANGLFGAGMVRTGSAGGPGKQVRLHDALPSCWLLQGANGPITTRDRNHTHTG
jgi:hypothetical protein